MKISHETWMIHTAPKNTLQVRHICFMWWWTCYIILEVYSVWKLDEIVLKDLRLKIALLTVFEANPFLLTTGIFFSIPSFPDNS